MPIEVKDSNLSEDTIFRLRAKMDDNSHTIMQEGGTRMLVYRTKGETIDLLRSLEHLSEFVPPDSYEGVEKLVLISDRNHDVLPGQMLRPKLEGKKKDDDGLYMELREKLTKTLTPIVFTTENDILELYRTAIRLEGSYKRTDSSVGLDLTKADLPKEGEIVYLVFDDGYRKMNRRTCETMMDDAIRSLREGPQLVRDPSRPMTTRGSSAPSRAETTWEAMTPDILTSASRAGQPPSDLTDPKVVAREFSKNMVSLGYRKDAVFSRTDTNQFFFIGLNMPAVFFKVLLDEEELSAFLRVLSHRRDALGILITREWTPRMEALSTRHHFIYLESSRAHLAHEVVMHLIREGTSS